MPETITIPRRFNGPQESGNGGYCAGVFASFVEGRAAEVTLRRPVPLDTHMTVASDEDGAVRVLDGETLVAEATVAVPEMEPPAPVGVADARRASARYRGSAEGQFSRCFICGRGRPDSFGVFAGEVEGRALVASPWTPPAWTAGDSGEVAAEFVWAVLDCPTYFATYLGVADPAAAVLGRLSARIDRPVRAGSEHVVIAWPLEVDGRKRHAGSAVLSAEGETLALASSVMIEPRAALGTEPPPAKPTNPAGQHLSRPLEEREAGPIPAHWPRPGPPIIDKRRRRR